MAYTLRWRLSAGWRSSPEVSAGWRSSPEVRARAGPQWARPEEWECLSQPNQDGTGEHSVLVTFVLL